MNYNSRLLCSSVTQHSLGERVLCDADKQRATRSKRKWDEWRDQTTKRGRIVWRDRTTCKIIWVKESCVTWSTSTECSKSCVVRRDQIKCKMPKKEACCVTWTNNVQHAPEESEMCDVPLQIHCMPLHAALCGTRRDMCLEICSAHVKRRGQTMCKKGLEERVSFEKTKKTSADILLEETK